PSPRPAHPPRTRLDDRAPGPLDRGEVALPARSGASQPNAGRRPPRHRDDPVGAERAPERPNRRRQPPRLTEVHMILAEHLITAIDDLHLADRPVMLHTSLRSFGMAIAGGADTLLDALLKRGCTVMAPTFTEPQFSLPAPAGMRPARNGLDYAALPSGTALPEGPAYSVDCGLINPHLGVLPAVLIGRVGTVRGRHPLNSFAAVGPQAAELIDAQSPNDVYGPIRELADRDGAILLVGVSLNRMTALHLAEQRS